MKKKLLFINGHLNTGGVEKSLMDILTHLDYARYDVDLLLTEHLGDYADQLPPQVNVLLRSIEGTYGSFPRVALRCLCRRDWFSLKMRLIFLAMKLFGQKQIAMAQHMLTGKTQYDCVVGFRPGLCTQIAAYAVNAKQRIAWWHHGEINIDPPSYLEAAGRCDQIAVVSESCRHMLASAFPTLEDQLVTIHNMMDVSAVKQKADAFDPYSEKDILHLVSVGRLAPEKHFENAIFAARKLMDRGIPFQWHLVGDGVLRDELWQKAVELDVTDCFIFEGNQVNPYPYMKHADLFVHPSYVESFGIVVTEALALGIPCVVTKSTGVMDFLNAGENALLTEQNPNDLAAKVLQVLTDAGLRDRLRNNASCPEQFLPEVVMKKIEDLLEE
jgi:glycosyltransferase involved in cell wall biosynthesis